MKKLEARTYPRAHDCLCTEPNGYRRIQTETIYSLYMMRKAFQGSVGGSHKQKITTFACIIHNLLGSTQGKMA